MIWCLPWKRYVLSSAPKAIFFTQLPSVLACLQQHFTNYSFLIVTCLLPWSGEKESVGSTAEIALSALGQEAEQTNV